MQRLLFVIILAVIVIGFPILISGDTAIPTADPDIPDNEMAINVSEMGNSSASVTITITMYTGDDE